MEKVENDYKLLPNVNNITLSDDTRKIMACLAAIDDTYNIATDINRKYYVNEVDEHIADFSKAFFAYCEKMEQFLSLLITQTLGDSHYKKM